MKFTIFLLPLLTLPLLGEVKLPSFFSNGMVLQRETGAPLWGTASPDSEVTVTFNTSKVSTQANAEGHWRVNLENLEASTKGTSLTVTEGDHTVTLNDVLVGEVWIASGQSNMEWPMKSTKSAAYAKKVNTPLIRQYGGSNVSSATPQQNYKGTWKKATPQNTSTFSAVAFHFAEDLSQSLNVPVGIIELAWGGKPVEAFISEEAIKKLPEAEDLIKKKEIAIKQYDPEKAEQAYQKSLLDHQKVLEQWKKEKKEKKEKKGKKEKPPKKPVIQPDPSTHPNNHSTIYNGMISPLAGYGARGVIWYQGESNTVVETAQIYDELLETMVQDWRTRWGRNLSFYQVQLANFTAKEGREWELVQDEQRRSIETIPNSGIAIINDIGDESNIHPKNKKDVGLRLARWARVKDYGEKDLLYSGPLYKEATFQGDTVTVSFHYDQGLKSSDGKALTWFEVAGAEGKWVSATAVVDGNTIKVSSDEIPEPTMVRYAWHDNLKGANLTNASGLPASCFTSEDVD